MTDERKSRSPRDWWGYGIVALTLGTGGLVRLLSDPDPQTAGFFVGGLLFSLGLFLTIASAVAHGTKS